MQSKNPEWEIWHYGKANLDHIRKSINEFPWEIKFENNTTIQTHTL